MSNAVVVGGPERADRSIDRSSVLSAIRDLAVREPGRVAVVGEDGTLGYGELWRRATELAHALGRDPGVVGVDAVHTPDTVVSLLAVWAAGGTYCPIDPAYPREHADALLDAVEGPMPDDTAYVLFTSGSTGRPKPVAVSHQALDVVVPALRELFEIGPEDRVLQLASLSWDTSFEELLPSLAAGARVVFGCDAYSGSLSRLLRLIDTRGVTVLDLPTALWHELVLHLDTVGAALPDSVRLVIIGGEAASPARLATWRALPGAGDIRLLNTYGATETALITHAVDLHNPAVMGVEVGGVPIGRPLPHVVQRITAEGELLVGGPSLAHGYPGLPEATAERFVESDGVRFFCTGDLVCERADGVLDHVGRLDAQVKIRGIRVDPGDVEAHLSRHPGVSAVAVTSATLSGRTVLAAYVVPTAPPRPDGTSDLIADLRGFMRARAPAHLHPARLTVVSSLVLTTSGKVDRRATHARYSPPNRPPDPPVPEERPR
jgi:nonribosomal peptide synthetase protein VioO